MSYSKPVMLSAGISNLENANIFFRGLSGGSNVIYIWPL